MKIILTQDAKLLSVKIYTVFLAVWGCNKGWQVWTFGEV